MNRFMNHRTRRRTAWLMLFVWMFALASGVANACALEARGSHTDAMVAGDRSDVASWAHAAEDSGADLDHDGDSHDSKAPCLKACDEGSLSLLKHSVVPDLTDPGAAFVVAFAWAVSVPVLSARSRAHHLRPLSSGPPLRVRYMRLAL